MAFYFNEDARVHVNLSNYAWNVIHEDMFVFCRDDLANLSGFINDIILSYYQEADASIQTRCDEIASNYEQLLSEESVNMKIDPSIQYSVIDVVTRSFKNRVIDKINSYPKDKYKKIKLRKNVAEILLDSQEYSFYEDNVSNYIKAIIEEFVRLPFLKRESIICKENHDLIEKAIHSHKRLKIIVGTKKEFEVIPYQITTDKLGMFNYLIGIDVNTKQPVSYRISRLKIKLLSKIGKINKTYEEAILSKLAIVDASFLTKETERIVVRFDSYGLSKYNNQLHMRPQYIEQLDDNCFVFNCSTDQAKFYFLKFGSSALILEPEWLSKSFRNFYNYALQRYNDYFDSNK